MNINYKMKKIPMFKQNNNDNRKSAMETVMTELNVQTHGHDVLHAKFVFL